jgi:hypothetical protein
MIGMGMMYLALVSFIISSDAFDMKSNELSSLTLSHRIASQNRYYFSVQTNPRQRFNEIRTTITLQQKTTDDVDDATSKGIVSLLTNVVNSVFDTWSILFSRTASLQSSHNNIAVLPQPQPPSSPFELLDRIRNDYTERNYLWTGDLDLEANFVKSCQFTDPTLSFVGTDNYIKNIENLRPILNLVTNVETECRSDLLDIQLYDTYIQTRWNMIGTLSRLPWKPKIDVIGKTKFWYHNDTNQVYFYDEMWEIPANQALLQLVTPTTYKS